MKTTSELLKEAGVPDVRPERWTAHLFSMERFAALVRDQYREDLFGTDMEPIAFVSLAIWQSGKYRPDDCFGEVKGDDDCAVYTAKQLAAAVVRAKDLK